MSFLLTVPSIDRSVKCRAMRQYQSTSLEMFIKFVKKFIWQMFSKQQQQGSGGSVGRAGDVSCRGRAPGDDGREQDLQCGDCGQGYWPTSRGGGWRRSARSTKEIKLKGP